MSLKTFCLLVSGALMIMVGGIASYLFPLLQSFKGCLLIIFICVVILWPILNWFIKSKIIIHLKPISLIDDDGTILYCVKENQLAVYGMFRKRFDPLEKITIADLFYQYIDLPVMMEFEEERSFNLPFDYSLNFKIKNLRVYFHEAMDTGPLNLISHYSSRHNAEDAIRRAIKKALQATFDEKVKTEDKQLVFGDNFKVEALKILFLSKLEEALKNDLYKYDYKGFDFLVTLKSI